MPTYRIVEGFDFKIFDGERFVIDFFSRKDAEDWIKWMGQTRNYIPE